MSEQNNNEAILNNRDIACAIAAKHNKLSPLDISKVEHYNRCHARGRVPVTHHSGGWFNSYAAISLILLYLRLPDELKSFCIKPPGLRAHKAKERKAKSAAR